MTPVPSRSDLNTWIAEQIASGILPPGYALPAVVNPTLPADAPPETPAVYPSADDLAVQQNSQSANYNIQLSDAGKHLYHPSSDTTPRTFTIPASGSVDFPLGTAITFVNGNGAGTLTIACNDTMRQAGTGTTGSRTLAANGIATAMKITSSSWLINGTGLT